MLISLCLALLMSLGLLVSAEGMTAEEAAPPEDYDSLISTFSSNTVAPSMYTPYTSAYQSTYRVIQNSGGFWYHAWTFNSVGWDVGASTYDWGLDCKSAVLTAGKKYVIAFDVNYLNTVFKSPSNLVVTIQTSRGTYTCQPTSSTIDGAYSYVRYTGYFEWPEGYPSGSFKIRVSYYINQNLGKYDSTFFYIFNPSINYTSDAERFEALEDAVDQKVNDAKNEILQQQEQLKDQVIENQDKNTEKIGGFFQGLLDGLLNGIKSFFIPDASYFTEFFDDWNTWFAEHFGILYYPFDFFIDICNRFINLEVPEHPSITFPAIQVGETVLLESQQFDFGMDSLPALKNLHTTYLYVVDVIIAFWLINFARVKINEIMSGS